jgi:hypothetical protein
MEDELHGGCFLKIRNWHLNLKKKSETKTLGVDNVELYRCAKYLLKIHCFPGYTKIINLKKIQVFKSTYLSFLVSLKYNEFGFGFLHTSRCLHL